MKKHSYSFDLNILDNSSTTKVNSIKLSDCYWVLILLISNTLLQIIFLYEFLLIINLVIFCVFSYLFYILRNFEENDIYEIDKMEFLEKSIKYFYFLLLSSIIFSVITLGISFDQLIKFNSKVLLEKYFSILNMFCLFLKIICTYLYKKFVKDMFPFYKVNDKEEN